MYVADRSVMDEIVGFPIHRVCWRPGSASRRGRWIRCCGARACLVLESLANHDNVGGMMRGCGSWRVR